MYLRQQTLPALVSTCPGSVRLSALPWPCRGLATGLSASYCPFSSQRDLTAVGSNHFSCQNGFLTFRENSGVLCQGLCVGSSLGLCFSFLRTPQGSRAAFRLLLKGDSLFVREAWALCHRLLYGKETHPAIPLGTVLVPLRVFSSIQCGRH